MFLSRRSHADILAAKESQIAALRDEIKFLRHMVQPRYQPDTLQMEADAVIGGNQEQIAPEAERKAEIDSEAARILSGTY
jgi:hypothetical protein